MAPLVSRQSSNGHGEMNEEPCNMVTNRTLPAIMFTLVGMVLITCIEAYLTQRILARNLPKGSSSLVSAP